MICMKNLRFSSRLRAKVRRQGPPGSARAQPCPRVNEDASEHWSSKSALSNVEFHNYLLPNLVTALEH